MNNDIQFWAYLHSNGQVIVKRWFGDVKDYTTDVQGNDFVAQVVPPFTAKSREEAEQIAMQRLIAERDNFHRGWGGGGSQTGADESLRFGSILA